MVYIASKEPPIRTETTETNARTWLNIIRYREYGVVIQLQDDSPYRVADILEDSTLLKKFLGPYYRKYLVKYIALDQEALAPSIRTSLLSLCMEKKIQLETPKDLDINQLLEIIGDAGYEVGLFIGGVSSLLTEENYSQLFELEHILEKSRNFSVILFTETDITADTFNTLRVKCSLIFDHVIRYPLYDQTDCRQFIRYNNSMWDMHLPLETELEIIRLSGGYLWLISALQRYLRDNPKTDVKDAEEDFVLQSKLQTIWSKCTESEKIILRKVAGKTISEEDRASHEYRHLCDMRMILDSGKNNVLGIPLLTSVIKRERRIDGLKVENDRIYSEETDITSNFSESERIFLTEMLKRKRKIVSRDDMAKLLWGEEWEDKYSDWAIDRLAYRLRKKMTQAGVDPDLIKSAKRKGFVFG
jgi:hypothetical protein